MPVNATVGDRGSMVFAGTMVVSGRATGAVVATGSETELGRINQLLADVSALDTPLLRQIKTFGYAITAVISVVTVLIFAYGKWVMGMDFAELFQAVVAIAVSTIPEGLPTLITVTLAIGVQRMAQRHAIIRRLPAVETLGSVSRMYLPGPHLASSLLNLGIVEPAREALAEFGLDLDQVIEQEEEPGLGDGGLGRLAACFMDSLGRRSTTR